MQVKQVFAGLILATLASVSVADFEPWTDYEVSEAVWNVTTVKVDSNMIEKYLEGLSQSWVTANEVAKELGHIEDYSVSVSELPNGGDFNVVLVIRYASSADMQPSKAKYDAFMKAWGDANEARSDELVMTYPDIREIVGEYTMRSVTFK